MLEIVFILHIINSHGNLSELLLFHFGHLVTFVTSFDPVWPYSTPFDPIWVKNEPRKDTRIVCYIICDTLAFWNSPSTSWYRMSWYWYSETWWTSLSTGTYRPGITGSFTNKLTKCNPCLTLIRESWKKNPKRGTVTERVFRKKIHSAALHHLYMFLCFGFFPGNRARSRSQKWHIFFSARHIPSHIGICHLKFAA